MASRVIGRVGIKLIPETKRFRQEAASDLKRIEKQLPDMKVDLRLNLNAKEKSKATAEVEAWEESTSPNLKVDIDLNKKDMAAVAAQLAALTRQREVDIAPRIDVGALAGAGAGIAALGGLRYVSGLIRKFRDELLNLDKVVPTIGVVQHAIAGLGAYVLGVSGNLFSLSNSLASMGKAGLALPGILGGIAVGLGVTVAALTDFNEEVPKAKGYLEDLQDTISGNFWDAAAKPIRSLVDELFPVLNKALVDTSSELGNFFGAFAASVETNMLDALPAMFENLAESIKVATQFTDFYVGILTILGQIGSSYLPALANYFGQLSARFYEFLRSAAEDGSLKKWVDEGILAMQNFGSVIGSTFSIFRSLGVAAEAAGGATLSSLADNLRDVAEAAASPGFQSGLTDTLSAVYEMMDQISTIAGPAVKRLIVTMAENFQSLAPTMGDTIGTAIGSIADALANPAVSAGLTAMTEGFNSMVHTLAPVMDTVAEKFEPLGILVGALAENIGTVLAAAIETLIPVFTSMADAITPVIEKLGPLFTGIIQDLAPVLEQIGSVITEKVGPALVGLVDAVQGLWDVIGPLLIPVLKVIVSILGDALKGVFDGLKLAIEGVTQVISGLVDFFKGLWDVIAGLFSGDMSRVSEGFGQMFDGVKGILMGALKTIFGAIWAYLNGTVFGIFRSIGAKVAGFFGAKFTGPIAKAFESIRGVLGKAWDWIKTQWDKIVGIFKGGESGGGGIAGALKGLGEKIIAPFRAAFNGVAGFLKGAWEIIRVIFDTAIKLIGEMLKIGLSVFRFIFVDTFAAIWKVIQAAWRIISEIFVTGFTVIRTILTDAIAGIKVFFEDMIQWFIGRFTGLVDFFAMLWSQIVAGFRLLGTKVQEIWFAFTEYVLTRLAAWKDLIIAGWNALKSGAIKAWNGLVKGVKAVLEFMAEFVKGFLDEIVAMVDMAWAGAKRLFEVVWGAISKFFTSTWKNISDTATRWGRKVRDFVNDAWNAIKSKTSSTWNSIKGALSDAWWSIRNTISGAINNVKSRLSSGWNRVKSDVSSAWNRVKTLISDAWDRVSGVVRDGINKVIKKVKGLKSDAKSALTGIGTTLFNAGKDLLNGFIDGIKDKWNAVKKKLTSLTDSLPDWKGPADKDKKLLRPAGRMIIDGLIKGFGEQFSNVRRSLQGLTADIQRTPIAADAGTGIGLDLGQSIVTGLRQSQASVLTEVTSLAESIANALDAVLNRSFGIDVDSTSRVSEEILQSAALDERLGTLEKNITRATRQRASETTPTSDESTISIGNLTIPLEDLKQLKDLEQFIDMLRVRARQG